MTRQRMPALFLGHGSPMNAIEDNALTRTWHRLGEALPKPRAILCVSAHWMTRGCAVTSSNVQRTIHDFRGFPKALHDVRYDAPGDPVLADEIVKWLAPEPVMLDQSWGLDHGAWSVLRHVYPEADVPVLQFALDSRRNAAEHLALAKRLARVRDEGVLLVATGNVVHNLHDIDWSSDAVPRPYAREVTERVKEALERRDVDALTAVPESDAGKAAAPTPEHFFPLLYLAGVIDGSDRLQFITDEIQNGSISMLGVVASPGSVLQIDTENNERAHAAPLR